MTSKEKKKLDRKRKNEHRRDGWKGMKQTGDADLLVVIAVTHSFSDSMHYTHVQSSIVHSVLSVVHPANCPG